MTPDGMAAEATPSLPIMAPGQPLSRHGFNFGPFDLGHPLKTSFFFQFFPKDSFQRETVYGVGCHAGRVFLLGWEGEGMRKGDSLMLYNLSDDALEQQTLDRLSFMLCAFWACG
jgi:hypothetical protein